MSESLDVHNNAPQPGFVDNFKNFLSEARGNTLAIMGTGAVAIGGGVALSELLGDTAVAQTDVPTQAGALPKKPEVTTFTVPDPYAIRGKSFGYDLYAKGQADKFVVRLAGHSRSLKLKSNLSKPKWHKVDEKPQMSMGRLKENEGYNSHKARILFGLSKYARLGSKACITLKMTGTNTNEFGKSTQINKIKLCQKVVAGGDPNQMNTR